MTPKLFSRNVRWGPKDGRGQYCVSVVLPEVLGASGGCMMSTGPWGTVWWCAQGRCVSDGSQWWTPWLDWGISPAGGQSESTHFDVSQNGLSDWGRHLYQGYGKVLKVHLRLTLTCDQSSLNQHYSVCERKQGCISTGNWTPLNWGAVSYQNVTIGL